MKNKVTNLLGIKYPIIQAGMIWCSGWRLASSVSNSGGLGIIGSGSMYPDTLKEHILKCKKATNFPFAVNLPLLYPNAEEHITTIIEQKVPIVFTSAGNPITWTAHLKSHNIKVVHVVSSVKFALKAGGHNGIEETTTFCLIPEVARQIKIPLIAAGGIVDGRGMLATMILGADAVQMGSRFVACKESSAHENFKKLVVEAKEGETKLTLKELTPVRLLNNDFFQEIMKLYNQNASKEMLKEKLGRGRAKLGMFEGDLKNGELEIGQASSQLKNILSASEIINQVINEFRDSGSKINNYPKFNF